MMRILHIKTTHKVWCDKHVVTLLSHSMQTKKKTLAVQGTLASQGEISMCGSAFKNKFAQIALPVKRCKPTKQEVNWIIHIFAWKMPVSLQTSRSSVARASKWKQRMCEKALYIIWRNGITPQQKQLQKRITLSCTKSNNATTKSILSLLAYLHSRSINAW